MKRVFTIGAPILVAIGLIGLFWYLIDGKTIPVLQPKGEIAAAQYDLFVFTTVLSLFVVIPVFSLLAFVAIRYRAGNKGASYRPEWGENKYLEGLWWGIPILIIGVLGVTIYQTSHALDPYKPLSGEKPMEIQVIALRWKWLFIYPEQQVATLNHLPIPTDRPITFKMSANAPMSAFWIPALGSQVYAMNGMSSELNLRANEPGEYKGYTTNINGEGYSKMVFTTRAMDVSAFDSWVETAALSTDAMNMKTYESLTEPESIPEERTYRLANAKLYEMVTESTGHSHGGSH